MAPGVGPRLRHLLAQLRDSCQAHVESNPDILEALHNLEEAVNVGFPLLARCRGRPPLKVTEQHEVEAAIGRAPCRQAKAGQTFDP